MHHTFKRPTYLLILLSLFSLVLGTDIVTISSTATFPVPTMWGATLDEINSIDGGLYGELVRNRAFQLVGPGTSQSLDAWHSIGGASLQVIRETVPISSGLPNALQVTFNGGRILPVGIGNDGYFGIRVDTSLTYSVSFWYRFPTASSFRGTVNAGFQTTGGLSFGSVNIPISGAQTTWTQVSGSFRPVQTPNNNNNWFSFTIDGSASVGQVVNFALFSVMAPTFRGRANGLRSDLATALQQMRPAFLRYPGANSLLGNSTDAFRWRWNNTVNTITTRAGHMTGSGYVSSDGFGLFDFLQFCEDISTRPIMTIFAGLSKDGSVIPESQLLPVVQDAIDQINFAIGPTSTPQGLLRSQMGHPGAFALQHVEIGANEENTSEEYQSRWTIFVTLLSQRFPQIRFIASSKLNMPPLVPDPTHWDVHLHATGGWFAHNSNHFDSFERNGTLYLISEFQADEGILQFPTMESAVNEAAFMTGLERNADIIFGAGHSPLLNNIAATTLSPSIISFNQNGLALSTSYLVQQMFAGTTFQFYNPSTLPNPDGNLFWSVTAAVQAGGSQFIIKLVNTADRPENVTFVLPHSYTVMSVRQISATTGSASNTPSAPNAVTTTFTQGSSRPASTMLTILAPPFSVNMVQTV